MRKGKISLLLVLALLCALLPQMRMTARAAESGYCGAEGDGRNLRWRFDASTGVLTIEGEGPMRDYASEADVPWIEYWNKINAIVLPEGLTSIGETAFASCEDLTSVAIPNRVERIGNYAFDCCVGLQSVSIGDAVTSIGESAFDSCCSLRKVHIGEAVTSIGECAFLDCTALNYVLIPASVTSIGDHAFGYEEIAWGWLAQLSLTIYGEENTAAQTYAEENGFPFFSSRNIVFGSCGAEGDNLSWVLNTESCQMTLYGSGAMMDYEHQNAVPWHDYCDTITELKLPNGLTRVGAFAFHDCSALTRVMIPDGVTSIGECAFWNCSALTSVTIPDSVTSIGEWAFEYCSSLTSVTIPDSVTSIGDGEFYCCSALTSVTIPDSVMSIGSSTFESCSSLTSVTIGNGVTSIGEAAFFRCSSLTSVTIPDSVTSIGDDAFYGCSALTSVTIPASVTSIGDSAFGYYWNEDTDKKERLAGFTIYGYKGTEAQRYAEKNRFAFVSLQVVNPFEDVTESDFYFNPVLWAVENNVTSGRDATHFAPNETVKRSEAMLFFYAAKGRPKFTTTKSPFKDVKKKHWFYDAVLWAVENKITSGTDATHFSPNKTCIRSEILQFLYAAMDKPEYMIANPYSDVKNKHWYYDGAIWAYEKGLEKGENGKFKAKTPCTRAYVVTYLYRFITGKELVQ